MAPSRKFPNHPQRRLDARRQPAPIRRVRAGRPLKRPQHRFLAYAFPSRSPGPTHPAVPGRPDFVAAAPTSATVPWLRLPPASTQPLRRPGDEGLPPPSGQTAPRGAPRKRSLVEARYRPPAQRLGHIDDLASLRQRSSEVQQRPGQPSRRSPNHRSASRAACDETLPYRERAHVAGRAPCASSHDDITFRSAPVRTSAFTTKMLTILSPTS
jgi:hypothetical protein